MFVNFQLAHIQEMDKLNGKAYMNCLVFGYFRGNFTPALAISVAVFTLGAGPFSFERLTIFPSLITASAFQTRIMESCVLCHSFRAPGKSMENLKMSYNVSS